MDATLAADMEAMRIEMEELAGEPGVIDGTPCTVIVPSQGLAQTIALGTFFDGKTMALSVRISLLAAAPINGTSKVTARGSDWRVVRVEPNLVTYELTLQSLNR